MLNHTKSPRLRLALMALVAGAGILLRLLDLDAPLWGDEIASWAYARRQPLASMVGFALTDPSPPLYYILLHGAMPLFGESEAGLRMVSVLFGVGAIWVADRLVRLVSADPGDRLPMLALTSLSSVLIYYSQEARQYMALGFFALAATYLLIRLAQEPTAARAGLYALAIAAACYSHFYGLFLFAAHLACLAASRRGKYALLSGGLVALALLPLILAKPFRPGGSGRPVGLASLAGYAGMLNAGTLGFVNDPAVANSPGLSFANPAWTKALLAAGALAMIVVALRVAYALYRGELSRSQAYLAGSIAIPALLAIAAGSPWSPQPQWLMRGLIYTVPLYFALIVSLPKSRLRTGVIAAIIALNLASLYPYYAMYAKSRYGEIFGQLHQLAAKDDLIVADDWYMYEVIDYNYDGPAPVIGFHPKLGWVDVERRQNTNDPQIQALPEKPAPAGRIFIYHKTFDMTWLDAFPANPIYVFNYDAGKWDVFRPAGGS